MSTERKAYSAESPHIPVLILWGVFLTHQIYTLEAWSMINQGGDSGEPLLMNVNERKHTLVPGPHPHFNPKCSQFIDLLSHTNQSN